MRPHFGVTAIGWTLEPRLSIFACKGLQSTAKLAQLRNPAGVRSKTDRFFDNSRIFPFEEGRHLKGVNRANREVQKYKTLRSPLAPVQPFD
jgi:hypothetical protein